MWPFSNAGAPIIAHKREQRNNALKSAPIFIAAQHQEILEAEASIIVQNISGGEWTASQVLEAYIARAAQAHDKTNCLTEIMFDTARQHAKALDEEFAKTGKVVGPLHGVPMSLKDQIEIVGYDASVGFTQWANKPSSKNADVVDLLLAAGAIPFVKTNVPQTMLAFECSNPLWGRTVNPHASAYTCGGSSGGEATLLAMSGSALGFGSDIGGSLRIPTSYCGVYALKPGHGRVSANGGKSIDPGFEAIPSVLGPMGRSVQDLIIAARLVFGHSDEVGTVAPLPFREVTLPRKLKFGYYTDDGFLNASPANERAVLETVDALRREGHECIELDWPFASDPVHISSNFFSADGYKGLLKPLGPDSKESSLFLAVYPPRLPRWLRAMIVWVVDTFIGDHQFAAIIRDARPKSVSEFYDNTAARKELEQRLYSEIWGQYGLDAIIAPVQAMPTIPHGTARDLSPIANATMMYNAADSPVGVLPVTRVDPTKDALKDGKWPVSKTGGSWILSQACQRAYDAKAMSGVPIGIQIVGRKWEDEKVLALMDVVDKALGERGFGPKGGASVKLEN